MKKLRIITTIIVTIFFSLTYAYADGNDSGPDELIDKNQAIIDRAKVNDWRTLAECADALISKRIISDEILNWIDRSIKIKETVYNRTVRGDFLVVQGKTTEAKKEYIKAISLAQKTGERSKIADIQWKILVAMGVENLNDFQAGGN